MTICLIYQKYRSGGLWERYLIQYLMHGEGVGWYAVSIWLCDFMGG